MQSVFLKTTELKYLRHSVPLTVFDVVMKLVFFFNYKNSKFCPELSRRQRLLISWIKQTVCERMFKPRSMKVFCQHILSCQGLISEVWHSQSFGSFPPNVWQLEQLLLNRPMFLWLSRQAVVMSLGYYLPFDKWK